MLNLQNVANLSITEGNVRTIHDGNSNLLWGRLTYDTKYTGNSSQSGDPDPNNPLPISNVTGTQTVTLSDGTNSETYTVNLGTIELCKIDNYQDYIYKSGDDWYVHKSIGKVISTGDSSETWSSANSNAIYRFENPTFLPIQPETSDIGTVISNYYTAQTYSQCYNSQVDYGICLQKSNPYICVRNKDIIGVSALRGWLSAHNLIVYCALATPTDTKITDNTLIGQLEAIEKFITRYGYNSSVSGNLPILIQKTNI